MIGSWSLRVSRRNDGGRLCTFPPKPSDRVTSRLRVFLPPSSRLQYEVSRAFRPAVAPLGAIGLELQ